MAKAAFVSQPDYDPESLERAIARSCELAGFDIGSTKGRRVLLKPNMLGAYPPSMGITTHPEFVAAAARLFVRAGAEVFVGDSPNWVHDIERTWVVTGIREAAEGAGAKAISLEAAGSAEIEGVLISKAVLDSDIVVNLPKFKTHGLTVMTLAAKNLFGCVSGMLKSGYHRAAPAPEDFAETIARVAHAVGPAISIIDGIVAMEGNGPSSGDLKRLGLVAAATDINALDAACCRLIGLPPEDLDTLAAAVRLGYWSFEEPIDIVGDPVGPIDFALPATYTRGMRDWRISRFVLARIWAGSWARPVIDRSRCVRCMLCAGGCPVGAISEEAGGGAPSIDKKGCIQCLCCHELCPHRAIGLERSIGVRVVSFLSSLRSRIARARGDVRRGR